MPNILMSFLFAFQHDFICYYLTFILYYFYSIILFSENAQTKTFTIQGTLWISPSSSILNMYNQFHKISTIYQWLKEDWTFPTTTLISRIFKKINK